MKTIGIVGAGTMGSGIAYVAAASDHKVLLYDLSKEQLRKAHSRIQELATNAVSKNLLSPESAHQTLARVQTQRNLEGLSRADLIIEAAVEDLKTKKELFRQFDASSKPTTILATNTSSFSVTDLASATKHPGRVAGMHFFNPPHLMKLVEVVRGHRSSETTISALVDVARRMGKITVVVRDTPGFIVNRIARPFYGEALRLLGEGVSTVEEIDRIVRLEGGVCDGAVRVDGSHRHRRELRGHAIRLRTVFP